MGKKSRSAIAVTALLISPMGAYAVPVVYDFTGQGTVCTYTGTGTDQSCEYVSVFSGTVSIDVLAETPSGDDSDYGSTLAWDRNGWVQSEFVIRWGDREFSPEPAPEESSASSYALVYNDHSGTDLIDQLQNSQSYLGPGGSYRSNASLNRQTRDTTWLSDLAFNTSVGLAPFGVNEIRFENTSFAYSNGSYYADHSGFFGRMDLSSFTMRAAPVPEPGTFALLAFGLAGLSVACRRRSRFR